MIERVARTIGYVVMIGAGIYMLLLASSVLIAIFFPLLVVGTYFSFLAILLGAIGFVAYKIIFWVIE